MQIHMAHCKTQMQSPLFKNDYKFQDGKSRALKQARATQAIMSLKSPLTEALVFPVPCVAEEPFG